MSDFEICFVIFFQSCFTRRPSLNIDYKNAIKNRIQIQRPKKSQSTIRIRNTRFLVKDVPKLIKMFGISYIFCTKLCCWVLGENKNKVKNYCPYLTAIIQAINSFVGVFFKDCMLDPVSGWMWELLSARRDQGETYPGPQGRILIRFYALVKSFIDNIYLLFSTPPFKKNFPI